MNNYALFIRLMERKLPNEILSSPILEQLFDISVTAVLSGMVTFLNTMRAKLSGAVYCYPSSLCATGGRALCVCGFIGLLPR